MVVIGPMVVIHSAPLASIEGGVLPAFKDCPTLFNEHSCLTQRKVQNVAFATIGHVDSIELVREFLREPDFHGRKETSNTRALLHLKIQNARPKLGISMRGNSADERHDPNRAQNQTRTTAGRSGSEKRTSFRTQPITERSPVPLCNALVAT